MKKVEKKFVSLFQKLIDLEKITTVHLEEIVLKEELISKNNQWLNL